MLTLDYIYDELSSSPSMDLQQICSQLANPKHAKTYIQRLTQDAKPHARHFAFPAMLFYAYGEDIVRAALELWIPNNACSYEMLTFVSAFDASSDVEFSVWFQTLNGVFYKQPLTIKTHMVKFVIPMIQHVNPTQWSHFIQDWIKQMPFCSKQNMEEYGGLFRHVQMLVDLQSIHCKQYDLLDVWIPRAISFFMLSETTFDKSVVLIALRDVDLQMKHKMDLIRICYHNEYYPTEFFTLDYYDPLSYLITYSLMSTDEYEWKRAFVALSFIQWKEPLASEWRNRILLHVDHPTMIQYLTKSRKLLETIISNDVSRISNIISSICVCTSENIKYVFTCIIYTIHRLVMALFSFVTLENDYLKLFKTYCEFLRTNSLHLDNCAFNPKQIHFAQLHKAIQYVLPLEFSQQEQIFIASSYPHITEEVESITMSILQKCSAIKLHHKVDAISTVQLISYMNQTTHGRPHVMKWIEQNQLVKRVTDCYDVKEMETNAHIFSLLCFHKLLEPRVVKRFVKYLSISPSLIGNKSIQSAVIISICRYIDFLKLDKCRSIIFSMKNTTVPFIYSKILPYDVAKELKNEYIASAMQQMGALTFVMYYQLAMEGLLYLMTRVTLHDVHPIYFTILANYAQSCIDESMRYAIAKLFGHLKTILGEQQWQHITKDLDKFQLRKLLRELSPFADGTRKQYTTDVLVQCCR